MNIDKVVFVLLYAVLKNQISNCVL